MTDVPTPAARSAPAAASAGRRHFVPVWAILLGLVVAQAVILWLAWPGTP